MTFKTKRLSKQTSMWRRCFFIFMACFALSFTTNAQVNSFMEILERYNNFNFEMRSTPYGQQLNNYSFENWETVSGSSVEPTNWNSFMTAEGTYSGSAKDQISKSTEKRPGTTGSYCARIFSKKIFIVIANGNMTTGRIYAGSMSANNDGNYNYTKRSDSNFNTPLTTIPDSLTVWIAHKPKNTSGVARITTTIHGDVDMKQLAKSGDSPADMVCATANKEISPKSTSSIVWERITIPFTAGPHNDPRYILTTFNTNKTPGGGKDGDELYVDDICLIYNPTLNLDLAQTEYQYSGNGVTMNINVPFSLTGSMSTYNLNKAANEVIAQLSDANGSFENPVELGRVTTNTSGTINGVIPAGLAASANYKVRVVSTNYPMTSNTTNVTISYPYVPAPEVAITLGTVAHKSAVATFTPNADCSQYYFLVAKATESVNAAYVKANGEVKSGEFTKTWNDLTSNTDYKVYALPVASDNTEGEMATATFNTNAFVPSIEIAQESVTVKSISTAFTPNSDCAQYYFLIALATENVNAAYVKANGEVKTSAFTKTFENLISNTNYKVYALPVDAEGAEGALKTLAVKTQAYAPQVDIVRNDFTVNSITATFTPNADCDEYYFLIASATENIDAAYIKANGEKQTAAFTETFEGLTSNTAYAIYALPVDADGFFGEVKTINVTTKAFVPQVAIAQGEVTTKTATATFTPNADCAKYYFLIATSAENIDAAYVKANGEVKSGEFTKTWSGLTSNTDYTIYALPIDVENNEASLNTLDIKTDAFAPQVDVERNNFSAKTITATFTPNADCIEYYFMIATDEVVDAGILKAYGERQTATFTKTFENLTSNTAYTIYALPVDVDGFYGEIKAVTITTKTLVPQVEITKGDVMTYSMTATFTPNADCAQYYFAIAMASENIDAEYVKANGELVDETHTHAWENLNSNTEYKIYALPVDIEGNEGTLNSLLVKTKVEAGVSEVDLDIEKLSETSVKLTATPNENTVLYHYIVMTKAEADAMGEDALMQMLNENDDYLTDVDVYTMTVESNVAYYVLAQGKNADDIWGVVTKLEFVVAGPAAVEIAVEKLTETTVEVTATPNENAVSYQYIVIKKAEADAMDEAALMQKLEEANELSGVDIWTWTVESNVEYYVIAQAKNADGRAGEIAQVEFVVAGPATVAIAVEEVSETSVEITATPNENAVLYHYIVVEKAMADAMGEDALMQELEENEDYLEGVNVSEVTIESNVEYYVVAQAKNADGKWGALVKVEFVVEVAGPASVAIEVEETSNTTVTVTATPNENAVVYHYILVKKAEADAMGEDALLQMLDENETYLEGVDVCDWTVESNVEYYVVAQAKNADDKWGEVTTVEFVVEVAGPAIVTIEVEAISETSVEITATPNENAVEYHYIVIEKTEADEIGEDAIMEMLNENEDYLEGVDVSTVTVEINVRYYVVAQAKNADDIWGEVTKVEFVVEDDAVEELGDAVFEIYPNPAKEYVRITSDSNIEELSIFTVEGKMVYSQSVNQQETMIDVAGFDRGTYVVRMIANDKIVVKRIMVL